MKRRLKSLKICSEPRNPARRHRLRARLVRHGDRGFTLIELMVVIAIIVLAAGLMTPTISDFFKNRQLDSVKGQLGSAFNRARLKAVTEGTRASLVFFREGARVFDERRMTFENDLFNPDNTPLSKGHVWYVLGFLGGTPSTKLESFRAWESEQRKLREARSKEGPSQGQEPLETYNLEYPKRIPRILFERDGSLTFATGADVGSNYFKEEPIPSNSDITIYQSNNTTACFVDFRPAGQIRSRIVPIGTIPKRPEEADNALSQ